MSYNHNIVIGCTLNIYLIILKMLLKLVQRRICLVKIFSEQKSSNITSRQHVIIKSFFPHIIFNLFLLTFCKIYNPQIQDIQIHKYK